MKIKNNSNYTNENFSDLEFHNDRVELSEFEDFKLSCAFNSIQYNNDTNKRKSYKVKQGKKLLKTGLVENVTARAGRVRKKNIK